MPGPLSRTENVSSAHVETDSSGTTSAASAGVQGVVDQLLEQGALPAARPAPDLRRQFLLAEVFQSRSS